MNKSTVLIMNGINLNMFGRRDPGVYGTATLADINQSLQELAAELAVELEFFQTNFEGEFVEKLHQIQRDGLIAGLMVNAGAWTHYSYGIMDALAIVKIPIVEVHMSNVHAREEFRRFSILSQVCRGTVAGFGVDSYLLGLRALASILRNDAGEVSRSVVRQGSDCEI